MIVANFSTYRLQPIDTFLHFHFFFFFSALEMRRQLKKSPYVRAATSEYQPDHNRGLHPDRNRGLGERGKCRRRGVWESILRPCVAL